MTELLLLTVIAQQVLDAWLTIKYLAKGFRELNPLLGALMREIGSTPALLLVKSFVIAVLIAAWHYELAGLNIVLALLIAFYTFILIHNWRVANGR